MLLCARAHQLEVKVQLASGVVLRGIPKNLGGSNHQWFVEEVMFESTDPGTIVAVPDAASTKIIEPADGETAEYPNTAEMTQLLEYAEQNGLKVTATWGANRVTTTRSCTSIPTRRSILLWLVGGSAFNPLSKQRSITLHKPKNASVPIIEESREQVVQLAPRPCLDCHGLGVLHAPAWMGTRPCKCVAPQSERDQPWSITLRGKSTEEPERKWGWTVNGRFNGKPLSVAFNTIMSNHHTWATRCYCGKPEIDGILKKFAAIEMIRLQEECHEMAAARVLDLLRAEFPNGIEQ
jgi:hypothetical protein